MTTVAEPVRLGMLGSGFTTLLTVLQMPEAVRQILFGAIIVAVAAAYTRVTGES